MLRERIENGCVTLLSQSATGITEKKVSRVTFWRHGHCTSNGKLSSEGFQRAVGLGSDASSQPPDLINSSPYERTYRSACGFLQGIKSSEFCIKPAVIHKVSLLAPPCLGRENIAPEDLDHWASALAFLINCYSKQTERMQGTNYRWIVNFTHSVVVVNLLDRLIGWQIRPLNLQDCFNRIDYLKGFDFLTTVDKKGDKKYKILCESALFNPDMEELGQLVNRYKMLPYRGISYEG